MIDRVTHQTVQRSTLANLQLNLSKMANLQARMAGGKVITKPSDDPAGTASALRLRGDLRATTQYSRNASDGLGWLSAVDSALGESLAALREARDLTVQGSNSGALGQPSLDAIAVALEGIRDTLLEKANTTYLGRSVFAGTSDAGVAYAVTTAGDGTKVYTWTGSDTGSVQRRIAPDTTVRADSDGRNAFDTGNPSTTVFALIDAIAADLRAGVAVGPRLAELDQHMSAMLGEAADAGSRYGQLTGAQASTAKTLDDLKGQLSAVEDIDLAEVIVELQSQEVAYQAALGATARVLQPSLLDFLR